MGLGPLRGNFLPWQVPDKEQGVKTPWKDLFSTRNYKPRQADSPIAVNLRHPFHHKISDSDNAQAYKAPGPTYIHGRANNIRQNRPLPNYTSSLKFSMLNSGISLTVDHISTTFITRQSHTPVLPYTNANDR